MLELTAFVTVVSASLSNTDSADLVNSDPKSALTESIINAITAVRCLSVSAFFLVFLVADRREAASAVAPALTATAGKASPGSDVEKPRVVLQSGPVP
mmetsp:Transcript_1660/g.4313  ORF Transcript_1660/g.4313 Transcript_1660/m.4313 type:complete len:98 (-) Transcript_1660:108-401(-)